MSVKRLGKHIPGSPFKTKVNDADVGDALKAKVTGATLKEGKTHTENHFTVDKRSAGYGGLSLSIEGPSKAELSYTEYEDDTLDIMYKPTEPGYYVINIKFADHHVRGSPYTVKVSGDGTNLKRTETSRQRDAVPISDIEQKCMLTFKMSGITSFDLSATFVSPAGVVEDAEVTEVEDKIYCATFMPKEVGIHTLSIRCKEMHIAGSPFLVRFGIIGFNSLGII